MEIVLVVLMVSVLVCVGVLTIVVLIRSGANATTATDLRGEFATQRSELRDAFRSDREERESNSRSLRDEVERQSSAMLEQVDQLRKEIEQKLDKVRESVDEKLRATIAASLKENAERIDALSTINAMKHGELQTALREELEKLRDGNERKLERMRETVDEKLQGTLEKRLGESFALVSDRLEQVQKGLGEMQSLASDVGGLKRVLTNVKNRGGWGEVQLARQLEDLLTPDQYAENVAVKPGSNERVEFAIRMPGRGDDSFVYLAIDSKFPQEDYERLLDAQNGDDKAAIEAAGKAVERAIVEQAKTIAAKYIDPPHTTDFAILYLPTEGLFAEVIRRPGLASRLQTDHRIMVTGPTTLMAILNSLQMGFRTLAIEKRSSEVWKVLAAAKSEFSKYGQVWEKLGKQLETAQKTVQEAGVRNRAVERKLRDVESPDAIDSPADLIAEVRGELEAATPRAPEIDPTLVGLGGTPADESAAV